MITSKTLSSVCFLTTLFNLGQVVQSRVKITQARMVSAKFEFRCKSFILSRNVFEQREKIPWLSVNWPSNNFALYNIYCTSKTKSSFYTPDMLWSVSPQITST